MKKTYISPEIKTVVLDSCSLMAGSIMGGDPGTLGDHGQAKDNVLFLDEGTLFDEETNWIEE